MTLCMFGFYRHRIGWLSGGSNRTFEDHLKRSRNKIIQSRVDAFDANPDGAIAQKSDTIWVAANNCHQKCVRMNGAFIPVVYFDDKKLAYLKGEADRTLLAYQSDQRS